NISEIIFDSRNDPMIKIIQNLNAGSLFIENSRKLKCLIINDDFIATKLQKIMDVEISECPNLKDINFFDNKLYNINKLLSMLDPTIITSIWLNKNNFDSSLVPFEKFTKVEELGLSENQFRGSLGLLVNLKNPKILVFSYIHINSGLEFLGMNLDQFYCSYNSVGYEVVKIQEKITEVYS
ncbi:10955_t:CDS:2, partial [Cetraspora pellucida]